MTHQRSALMDSLKRCDELGLLPGAVGITFVLFISLSVGNRPPPLLLLGSFLISVLIYGIDRAADATSGPHQQHRKIPNWFMSAVVVLFTVLFLVAFTAGRWGVCFFYLITPIIAFLYSWPWVGRVLGKKSRYQCIKNIPLLKNFYVPACWSLFVLLTAVYLEKFPKVAVIPLLLIIYERTFQAVAGCDFKDLESDRSAGIVTLPVRFGLNPTVSFLQVIGSAGYLFVLASAWEGWINPRMWVLGAHYLVMAACLEKMRKPGADLTFYCALIDLLYLLWIPLALFLNM